MSKHGYISGSANHLRVVLICWLAWSCAAAGGQRSASTGAATTDSARVLDRAIAVVNNQVLLKSDLDLEMRIYRLLPIGGRAESSEPKALDRMITRALIEQQIVEEDPDGLEVAPEELEKSLAELRESLPACRHRECSTGSASGAAWGEYLKTLGLTPDEVQGYWANRMAVLRFIEQRFRSGIRITPEEIEKYYRESLVPMYARPEEAPKEASVEARIQEILLQQRVNVMLNEWLKSLKEQGQVEILDPSLQTAETKPEAKLDEGSGH